MSLMAVRGSALVKDLSRQAARRRLLSLSRQWVMATLGLALAVSFVSVGLYVKLLFWVLFVACVAYYAHVLRLPAENSAPITFAPSNGGCAPVTATPLTTYPRDLTSSATRSSATTAQQPPVWTDLRPAPASPEPRSIVSYHPADASRLTETMLRMRRSPSNESFVTTQGLPPTSSSIPALQSRVGSGFGGGVSPLPSTPMPYSSPLGGTARGAQSYHLSPMSQLTSPVAAPDLSSSLGSAKWGPSSVRVRDSLKALQFSQIRDEWVEELRLLLGKHLISLLKTFDEAVSDLSSWLSRTGAQALSSEDIKRVLTLIDFSADQRRVRLSTHQTVSLEDTLAFCRQLGVPADLLHRYNMAASFFRVCQAMVDAKAPNVSEEAAPETHSAVFGSANSTASTLRGGRRGQKTFVARLKDMMFHSMDGRLRVQWPAASGSAQGQSQGMDGLSDQEIAVAVFLHKCDSLAQWKPTFSSHNGKFSQVHYAASYKDVQRIVGSVMCSVAAPLRSLSSVRGSETAESWCICLLLNPPTAGAGAEVSKDARAAGSAHFGVFRSSTREGKDLLSVDRGRNDCFEAIIVLLIVLFLTYQYSDDDASVRGERDRGLGASSTSPIVDYVIAKELLREIMGSDDLESLSAPPQAREEDADDSSVDYSRLQSSSFSHTSQTMHSFAPSGFGSFSAGGFSLVR